MSDTGAALDIFSLKDRIVLFSGGGGILGQAMARGLARAGATVFITSRTSEKAERVAAELAGDTLDIRGVALDVCDMSSIKAVISTLQETHSINRIDVLVNGAGGNTPGATVAPDADITAITPEGFANAIDLNATGTFFLTQHCLPLLLESEAGRVINIGSMAGGERPLTRVPVYALSKAAVHNLTAFLATEFATKYDGRLLCNAIAPGFFLTEQNWELLVTNPRGSKGPYEYTDRGRSIVAQTPMSRLGDAEELVGLTIFLASTASSFVTGQVIAVDGGFSKFAV